MSTKITQLDTNKINQLDTDYQYKNQIERIEKLEQELFEIKMLYLNIFSKLYYCPEINKELNCGINNEVLNKLKGE